jgi:hypothetical protein
MPQSAKPCLVASQLVTSSTRLNPSSPPVSSPSLTSTSKGTIILMLIGTRSTNASHTPSTSLAPLRHLRLPLLPPLKYPSKLQQPSQLSPQKLLASQHNALKEGIGPTITTGTIKFTAAIRATSMSSVRVGGQGRPHSLNSVWPCKSAAMSYFWRKCYGSNNVLT